LKIPQTGQEQTNLEPPGWREPALLPRDKHEQGSNEDEHPHRKVKQPVGDGVRLQPFDGCDRVSLSVANHVMPLQQLVDDDAINEATEPEPKQQPGCS
jgi:hypothetical protein